MEEKGNGEFQIDVQPQETKNLICFDLDDSTGGFTEGILRHCAHHQYADCSIME